MNAKEYFQKQLTSLHYLVDAATKDLTDDELNYTPPGTTNPVGLTWLHLLDSEDQFIAQLETRKTIWEQAGWDQRLGFERLPRIGDDWHDLRANLMRVDDLLAYQEAIRQSTDAYLQNLTADQFTQPVKFLSREVEIVDVLVLLISHSLFHAGEISNLRGVQGAQGLPF